MLQAYDLNNLPNDLNTWMMNRFLEPILYIEGGWQYWIQIDFPAWLDVNNPIQYDFRREVAPPELPNIRLDWLLNSQIQNQKATAVEIKAQTHKYSNQKFITDVNSDVQKLNNNALAAYHKLVLAVVIAPEARDILIQQPNNFFEIVNHNNQVSFLVRTW